MSKLVLFISFLFSSITFAAEVDLNGYQKFDFDGFTFLDRMSHYVQSLENENQLRSDDINKLKIYTSKIDSVRKKLEEEIAEFNSFDKDKILKMIDEKKSLFLKDQIPKEELLYEISLMLQLRKIYFEFEINENKSLIQVKENNLKPFRNKINQIRLFNRYLGSLLIGCAVWFSIFLSPFLTNFPFIKILIAIVISDIVAVKSVKKFVNNSEISFQIRSHQYEKQDIKQIKGQVKQLKQSMLSGSGDHQLAHIILKDLNLILESLKNKLSSNRCEFEFQSFFENEFSYRKVLP
tara:strand:- start:1211 stop:2089 length:879 start_codon:yes stop_codon:yes gene_type:complete